MKSSSYGSMSESCEPELTTSRDPETVLHKLYVDLCNLIVESRIPGINERGYGEGIHCPPLMGPNTHSCDLSIPECQKHQKLVHRLLCASNRNVFEIEVLMLPDCCDDTEPSERILCKEYILLERWSVNCSYGKVQSIMDVTQLLRAIRSFLYFSQISAWLSSSGGKTPSNIYYWIKSATELSAARFEREPELHTFPVCKIYEGLCLKIEVKHRTRSQYIPIIPCSKHPPHGNPYVSLTESSNSCQNVSVTDSVKYVRKSCGSNQSNIDNEENSLNNCNSSLFISSAISSVAAKVVCVEASGSKPKGVPMDTNSESHFVNLLGSASNLYEDVEGTKSITIPKSHTSGTCIDIYSNNASQKNVSLRKDVNAGYQEVYFNELNEETSDSKSVVDDSPSLEYPMYFLDEGLSNSKVSTNITSTHILNDNSERGNASLPSSLSKKVKRECKPCSSEHLLGRESSRDKLNLEKGNNAQRCESRRIPSYQNCNKNLSTVPDLPRKVAKRSKLKLQRNSTLPNINFSYSKLQNFSQCVINQNELEPSNLAVNKLCSLKRYCNVDTREIFLNMQNGRNSKFVNDVFVAKSSNNLDPQSSQVSSVPKISDAVASQAKVCRKRKFLESPISKTRSACNFQGYAVCEMSNLTNVFLKPSANGSEYDSLNNNSGESGKYLLNTFSKCDNKSAQIIFLKRKNSKNSLRGHNFLNSRSRSLDQVSFGENKCDILGKSILNCNYEVDEPLDTISENGLVESPSFLLETGTTAKNYLQQHVESSLAISKSKVISFTHSLPVLKKEWHSTSICCETKTCSFAPLLHLPYGNVPKVKLPPVKSENSDSFSFQFYSSENVIGRNGIDASHKLSQSKYNFLQNFHKNALQRKLNKRSTFSKILNKLNAISAEKALRLRHREKTLKFSCYLSRIAPSIALVIAETKLLSRNISIPKNKYIQLQKVNQMLRKVKQKATNGTESSINLWSRGCAMFKCRDTSVTDISKLSASVLSGAKNHPAICTAMTNLSQNLTFGGEETDSCSPVSTFNAACLNYTLKRKTEAMLAATSSLLDDFTSEPQKPSKRVLGDVKNTTENISRAKVCGLLPKPHSEVPLARQSQDASPLQGFLHASSLSHHLARKLNENFDGFPKHLLKFSKGKKLLGNFEESILKGCLQPVSRVEGFQAEIGASGSFCPDHLTLPADVYFYELGSPHQGATPYVAHVVLGDNEYYLPKKGALQVTLFNPTETVVKMFVLNYDLSLMPPMCHTFIRQKTYYMPVGATENDPSSQKWLRYIIHLRFASSRSGKIFLHKDFKIVVLNKSNDDAASDHIQEPRELRSFLSVPKNPMFSNFSYV